MPRLNDVQVTLFECVIFLAAEAYAIIYAPRIYRRARRRAARYGRVGFRGYPRSCDEKFHWRKVFDHAPEFARISDKLAVREWFREIDCPFPSVDVLWSGDSSRDIPADLRNSEHVLKSNHASGQVIMLDDCDLSDEALNELTQSWLAQDYSEVAGEWGYSQVKPKLFIEKRIAGHGRPVEDWKIYVFGDRIEKVVHLETHTDGRGGQVLEPDGKGGFSQISRVPDVADFLSTVSKPDAFEAILDEARRIGRRFDHMRIDFMVDGDKIYVGEMTIYNQSGWMPQGGEFPDTQISRAWDLRCSWFLTERQSTWFKRIYASVLHRAISRIGESSDLPPA